MRQKAVRNFLSAGLLCIALAECRATEASGPSQPPPATVAPSAGQVTATQQRVELTLDSDTKEILRRGSEEKFLKKDVVFSTVVGGLLVMLATWLAYHWQTRREKEDERAFLINVLKAIDSELSTIPKLTEVITKCLNGVEEKKPLTIFFGKTHNYFVVYEANALHLGKLSPEISGKIINAYFRIKELVDLFRLNDQWIFRYDAAFQDRTVQPNQRTKRIEEIESIMVELTTLLKEALTSANGALDESRAAIGREIGRYSKKS